MTMLDLDCKIYPCPINGSRYRPVLEKLGGRQQVPYLVVRIIIYAIFGKVEFLFARRQDPNTGVQMYESSHIVRYLLYAYGPGSEKLPYLLSETRLR